MKRNFGVKAAALSALLSVAVCQQVSAAEASKLDVSQLQPATEQETAEIKKLIHDLTGFSSPDFGLSATLSGSAFAPVAGSGQWQAALLTSHGVKTDPASLQLVKLGPKALPFLLDALDNQDDTGLAITHNRNYGGGMWYAHELWGNPANTNEQSIIGPQTNGLAGPRNEDLLGNYRVKVGDICFVIIGQIVGRPYQAVRYQPTAIIIINSPTHDAMLAKQVRAIWSGAHPAQHLLDSLLFDYASKGIFNGKSLDGWDEESQLQIGAAMRLLYYFPQHSADTISARLSHFDVRGTSTPKEPKDARSASDFFMHREVSNGVGTEDFIKAVAWCDEPAVRGEVQKIFLRTSDLGILAVSAVSMKQADPVAERKRLEELITDLPETEPGAFGEGYNLLVLLGKDAGDAAKPAFINYMQNASLQRRRSMCRVLLETQGQWSVELLAPLLDDKRPAEGWDYAVIPGQNEPRLPLRICDEAADTIAHNFPKLSFKEAGQHADLDRQIEKMKQQIVSKKS